MPFNSNIALITANFFEQIMEFINFIQQKLIYLIIKVNKYQIIKKLLTSKVPRFSERFPFPLEVDPIMPSEGRFPVLRKSFL